MQSAAAFQWLVIPFALTHPAVTLITETASGPDSWIGEIKADKSLGLYFDQLVSVILGGMPWQVSLHKGKVYDMLISKHWILVFCYAF